jgi:hypothetical protein
VASLALRSPCDTALVTSQSLTRPSESPVAAWPRLLSRPTAHTAAADDADGAEEEEEEEDCLALRGW